jgi:hypothetical protein
VKLAGAGLILALLMAAGTSLGRQPERPQIAQVPLHWQIAAQGNQALRHILRANLHELRRLQPPALDSLNPEVSAGMLASQPQPQG